MAHDDMGEVELGEAVEGRRPVLGVAVAHEGCPADHGVPGDHHLLPRQVDEHVALGVGAPQMEELDLAVTPVELQRPLEGDRRERRPERLDLGQIRPGQPQIRLVPLALRRRARRGEVRLELRDLVRHLTDVVLDALEPLPQHGLARELVGDDLRVGIGGRVHLVAVPVVPVEVRVDDVADRLRRDVAQPLDDHAGRRRLGVRVDDEDAVVALDDGGVGVHLVGGGGHRHVDAVGHPLDVEPRVSAPRSLMPATVHRRASFRVTLASLNASGAWCPARRGPSSPARRPAPRRTGSCTSPSRRTGTPRRPGPARPRSASRG